MIIRFWGVRGSYPVPGPQTVRYGGNTACVEVQAGGHTIILDAGTGIINLGTALMRRIQANGGHPMVATILFSHMHHDHSQGFPFFEPAYHGSSTLHILGPRVFESDLEDILMHAMLPPSFPISLDELASLKVVKNLNDTDIVLIGPDPQHVRVLNMYRDSISDSPELVRVSIYHSFAHPKNGVHIYRIAWRDKSVVYATDTEGYIDVDQRLVRLSRGADVLIHDAQYRREDYANPMRPKQGWGHSTPDMACAVAQAAQVKRLVLFHHDPKATDDQLAEMEREAQEIFPQSCMAYEGLEIEL
jgi:phosphoribosyl 1,2-cyclic phosphodiesterase